MADLLQPSTSDPHLQYHTDWTKCVLYQKGVDEELSCPADVMHSITGACCKTLADNLLGFCKINSLPNTTIDLTRMDDGDGMQATFQRNRAKYHDYC